MKKILAIISAVMVLSPLSAFAVSAAPTTAYLSAAPTYQILAECATATDQFLMHVYAPDGSASPNNSGGNDCDQFPDYIFTDTGGNGFFYYEQSETVVGTYTIIEAGLNADCSTIAACEADPDFVNEIFITMLAAPSSIFSIPITLVPAMTANVSDTIAGAGFSAVMLYSIAIVVLFWVMTRIIGVIQSPAERDKFDMKRFKTEADRIEHDYKDLRAFSRAFGEIGDEYRDKNTRK